MTIYPRQTLAVVGESGCGKSVTAMSSMQLVPRPPGRFDRGQILFRTDDGNTIDLLRLSEKEMRDIRGNDIAMAAFVGILLTFYSLSLSRGVGRAMPYGPSLAIATVLVLLAKPAVELGLSRITGQAVNLP